MKIISFAHTTPAFLEGRKTVTRREWSSVYAASFARGELVQAWDRLPRNAKARRIGTIRLTAAPVFSNEYPDEDYEAEGFGWFEQRGGGARVLGLPAPELWRKWQTERPWLWVVRFETHEVFPS